VLETSEEAMMARSDLTPFRLGDLMERRWAGDPFMSLYRDMGRLMEDAFRGLPLAGMSGGMVATPRMDVRESEGEICIETDLPGVSAKDLEVRLDEDVLTIRGERLSESREGSDSYHVMERSMGAFQRAMRLPFPVDPSEVKASFDNGVLTVILPKSAQQQMSRRIEVRSGAPGAGRIPGEPRSFAGSGSNGHGETARASAAETSRRKSEPAQNASAD
jgi:HSP20 family protein